MQYTLFCSEKCPLASVVLSVADITGDKIKLKAPDSTEIKNLELNFPNGTLVLDTHAGKIFGAGTILRFLARGSPYTNLYGRNNSDAAQVDTILHYVDSVILPIVKSICSCASGDSKSAVAEATKIFADLNKYLCSRTFVAGDRVTIADILLAVAVDSLVRYSGGSLSLKSLVNLDRFVSTITGQPCVNKHYSEYLSKCSKSCQSKPAAEQGGEASDEKPKKKENPLDSLPATSMSMDEWKRVYSNTKDLKGVAMPWLSQNFDPKGYSFFYMKYNKLPDELDVAFRASNMVGGFLQRLDNNFRKYSFGVINIVGQGNDFDYQGVFMFRGLEIPEEMKSHPSFEYHSFKRLDFSNPQDKQLITDYFCNDEEVEGLKIQDCKVWK